MRCGLFTSCRARTQITNISLAAENNLSKIKILSEHLANQIAAGEVIERPASVVKELLENSIDAGARQVQVEIEGSGTRLIKVIDDGMGMDADDALLCLERHATSKLAESTNDANRLAAIRSLGFRGEALPSIASVAKMSLTSRTENDPLGTRIEVRYGKVLKVHETGCNKGTAIEIKDLFGNLPARKKFLKSPRTELFHIEEIIRNYSLANYRLGITYTVNSNRVLDFAADTDTLEERVKMLFAAKGSTPLIPLMDPGASASAGAGILVTGFLCAPEQSFASAAKLRLFVNGRAVKDRMMAHAVSAGLSGYLMKGRTAAGAVFVTVPFEAVDVNVHPTKQEIRFQQPSRIHDIIVAAVRLGLDNYQQSAKHNLFGSGLEMKRAEEEQRFPTHKTKTGAHNVYRLWNSPPETTPKKDSLKAIGAGSLAPSRMETAFTPREDTESIATAEPLSPFSQTSADEIPVPEALKPIGQFMDLYILCEARREEQSYLVVIDQHAVHERIIFENLKKQFAARQMTSQSLLFPKMLELTPEHAAILGKNREKIRQLGLMVEEFGGDNYIIKAVPALISHLDPVEILTGILMEFSGPEYGQDEGRKHADATRLDDILSSMACKAAIKAGQNLNTLEMQALLKLMQESRAFTHCPHGRPVIRMFSAADIEKWFHRT
jgi:DNA mismatch repair protein MutL